jgi:Prealbumin-like fold domain
MAAFNFHRRQTRRWWYAGATLMAVAFFAVFFVVGASANLAGSNFEGNDGNLVVSTANNTDWCTDATAPVSPNLCTTPFPGLHTGVDLASGTGDNSFGQGTKEDSSAVTVVSGSIPPQKSDLTRFYEASETVGTDTFLYLAWERTNNLGNANMDFEINKSNPVPCPGTATGKCTIPRTNGDILVTYDFGGSGTPTLGDLRWLVAGEQNPDQVNHPGVNTASECFSSNTLPCWGDRVDLTAAGEAEGAVDTGASGVYDPIGVTGQTAGRQIVQNGFGEAAINLTAAGIVSSSSCDFGSATTFLKSRSSSSFTSEVKDFIAPVSTPITHCAKLTVIKHTLDPTGTRSGVSQTFTYTPSSNLNSGSTFTLNDATGSDVSCTGSNTCNKIAFSGLSGDTYTVTESDPSPGFALTDLSCVDTGTSTAHGGGTVASREATVVLAAGDDVTCTFTNQQQTGAIKITKVSSKGSTPLAGAQFTYALLTNGTPGTATNFPSTTDSNGHACVAGLPFGSYRIAESSAPTGYLADAGTQDVTVSAVGTCTTGTQATPTNSFVDTPLSTITLGFHSLAGAGVTSATVSCTNPSLASESLPEGDATVTLGNGTSTLTPGTYTCSVVVDP